MAGLAARCLVRDQSTLVLHLSLEHLNELLGPRTQLVLVPRQMSVNHLFAVFRIKFVLDQASRIAEVEHELAGPTDDLIGSLCDNWDFHDWGDQGELFTPLVLLF